MPEETFGVTRHEVDVEYGVFVLRDVLAPRDPLEWSVVGRGQDPLVTAAPYGAVLSSAGNDFRAVVDLTVGTAPPGDGPAGDGLAGDGPAGAGPAGAGEAWEREETVAFEAVSGTVRLASVNGVPAGDDVRLPAPGRYALRVRCRGRAAAAARRGRVFGYTGVEEWSLELWPV